jgi:cytochrome c biogenesis protein CcmG, thiol:disulfide interchange protein DsbE
MPILEDAFETYRNRGFTILAINNGESTDTVRAFAAQHGLTFPVILDPTRTIQRQFRMDSYPTSLFIDPNGMLYDSHLGAVTPDSLVSTIETGLARVTR